MKTIKFVIVILSGAGLLACSSYKVTTQTYDLLVISNASASDEAMDSLIAPYSRELAKEMNLVIGEAKTDMFVQRPYSRLGNWACDVLIQLGKDSLNLTNEPVVSLLNTGGLRASISKGPITVGDVFKVMPFDNQIVALKLPLDRMDQIAAYMKISGGEPIAGFKIINGKCSSLTNQSGKTYFWLITSDFLANGGDKMTFLSNPLEVRQTPFLLRDVFLAAVKKQKIIDAELEERITW